MTNPGRVELAGLIFGSKQLENSQPTNQTITITAVALSDSKDGAVDVILTEDVVGDNTLEEGADVVTTIPTTVSVKEGDELLITMYGGSAKDVVVTGKVGEGDMTEERLRDVELESLKVENLTAEQLEATNAYIETLTAGNLEADQILADHASVGELEADHVSVGDLTAAEARIGDLEADHVSVSEFNAEKANIDILQTATADIGTIRANAAKVQNLTAAQLEADHATIGTLDTTYMHADMSNSDVAWIQNGTIKNGAITNAMINDVSASKLTAGTIDASNITVTNLNADNITTGTINGQRIGQGSLSLDKLSEDVYTETEVDAKLSSMQDQIDGAIETWTGTAVPTLNNQPASDWTTSDVRDTHVGDVYFVVNSNSQQNGYNYRFTKNGSSYSWQLIKDNDVTQALQRLTTAEGKITTFESDISTLQTNTGTLTTKTESLETRMSDAESDILDKVDTTAFNSLEDTVDGHTQTLSQHTTAISNKADSSTVTAVTNRVSKNEQDISGINTTIGALQTTVESKADGSTVESVSNRLNTVSNTVDGHTQTITSVQNTLTSKADSSTVSTLRTEYNQTKTTVAGHETRLTATESVANGVRTDLDNLEIGGRNLLRWTEKPEYKESSWNKDPATTTGWARWSARWSIENTEDGIKGTVLSGSGQTGFAIPLAYEDAAVGGIEYTLSFDYRTDTTAIGDVYLLCDHGGNVKVHSVPCVASETNWQHYEQTITWPSTANKATRALLIPYIGNADSWFEIKNKSIKLEKGNKPTDWTPAPEDMQTEVTTLKTDYATYKQTTTESLSNIGTRMTNAEGRITSAESSIQQNANDITLRVSKTDYTGAKIASLINQSADTVTIEAEHINLNGSVKVSDLSQSVKDSIDDAAKTATNFVTLDAGGIVVGKLTDSTLGNNVLIDSDSVDIRNGTDVLASFGETVTVGSEDAAHVGITNRSMSVSDSDSTFFVAGDIRDENDYVTVTERVFVTSQGVTINTSFPIVSVRRIIGTGIGTVKDWEFDEESFSGTSIVIYLRPQGSYLPKGAALDVTYTTADYSQTHVLSFGKPRTGGGMNALLVDGDGSIDTIGGMHANGRGTFDEGIETANSVVAGSISTEMTDLVFGIPAYNSVFRRLVFTSIGNLRFDTSSDKETWAADSYFVKAPAALGTGAAGDYVTEVGSRDDATGIHWKWMKYASGYAIAWGYFTGSWSATTAWGALYYKETTRLPNPFTWAAAPYEWMQPRGTNYFWCVNHNDATASQTGTYYLMSPTSQSTARAATLDFLQIGRWK